jgi:beta-lactamase superfamily II metal-dependent hydrolase
MRHMNVVKLIPLLLLGMMLSFFSHGLWAQNLEIHYINVQQGQSTLIIGPNGTTILYDGGYEFKGTTEVVPYLQSLGITTSQPLDYIIASHRHTDHFMGLTETMNYGYDALHVYDNGSDYSNTYVDAFLSAAAGTTAGGVTAMTLGQVIDLGNGASATCVAVDGSVIGVGAIAGGQDNENDRSICLLVKYGDFDFLVTGDVGGGADDYLCTDRSTSQVNIETPMVQAIMPGGANPLLTSYGVEIAHVSHHGSESSTNSDYMNLLTPAVACIAVGDGQSSTWYHPRIAVVENVLLAGGTCITAAPALVLQTEEGSPTGSGTSYAGYCVGDIVITSDGGNSYSVDASGAVSQGPDERNGAGLPQTFYVEEYGGGDLPPVITNVHEENVTQTSADILWTTNEEADSLVRYGTVSGTYTETVSDSAMVYNHTISLSGLTEATTYYYVVESTDSGSNTTTSPEYSFSTTSPGGSSGVIFSEIYYDTVGTDADEEWIELYNNTGATVDIGGWTITDNNGTGATFTIPAGNTIAAGTYFTIAHNSAGFNALYGYDADIYGSIPFLNNDGDALLLKDGTGGLVDTVAWEGGASSGIPDGWGSSTDPSAPTGSTIERTDPGVDTDTYADWSTAANNGDPQTQATSTPPTPDVVFSEIYYDTVGTDADEEWIELYNNTDAAVDIGGWVITDNNGTGASYTIPAGTTIAAGTYLTIAHNSTGFYALYGYDADVYGSIPFLNNDGDTLIMTDDSAAVVDTVAWEGGASSGIPDGWGSTSAPSAATGYTIVRTDPAVDTDTYADWTTAPNNGNPQTQSGGNPDTTPPVISGVQETSITTDSAVIEWTTDEDSDSVVEYGTSSGNYTDSESDASMVTAHSISLSGLSPDTTYYYVVKSTDAAQNTATSAEYSFTTDPDVPSLMINTISMSAAKKGSKTSATAVIVVYANGSPLPDAVVDITWSGSVSDTDQVTTDSNGEATLKSIGIKDSIWTFTITVDGITKSGYTWDSAGSEVTETISN